jgi:hypothetical protein
VSGGFGRIMTERLLARGDRVAGLTPSPLVSLNRERIFQVQPFMTVV